MEELDAGLKPKTRRKIEQKLEEGWKFDAEAWAKSVERHKKYDMKQIFGQFDADGDGKLTLYEIARAFRALGLPKRDGTKMEMDKEMFKKFDVNNDGPHRRPLRLNPKHSPNPSEPQSQPLT